VKKSFKLIDLPLQSLVPARWRIGSL